ncbi:MAG: hypothetical protein ACHRHE_12145 [Tepidisphaerales bacterium]
MVVSKSTALFFSPASQYVEARIVALTKHLADRIHRDWWIDASLSEHFDPPPIDRYWNWNEIGIEYDGRPLESEKVAVVTADGAVQGAMMISVEAVPSVLAPGQGALFVEMLFTAPRNRPALRRDHEAFYLGVGTELLTYSGWLSHKNGHGGRLRLDGSPEFVNWYEKRGLQKVSAKPMLFEGVSYTPMELSDAAARMLLKDW